MIIPKHILISRTDSIGDVMLTLPLCAALKSHFPDAKLTFLGQNYTKPVLECCPFIDEIICWDDIEVKNKKEQNSFVKSLNIDVVLHVFPDRKIARLLAKTNVKYRVGTAGRWFHLLYCNRPVKMSRKKSELHEAQLNFKLLSPLGIYEIPSVENLTRMQVFKAPELKSVPDVFQKIARDKFNLILHPFSKGSAREWGIERFIQLTELLPVEKFNIFISGTADDLAKIEALNIAFRPNVHNIMGQMTLKEFISFIDKCNGFVGASTGPLHIAAMSGKKLLWDSMYH
ncbi:MAG: glycosyltransferase family 9 protein [Saprospiraceae bacterium]|nr:glycosyltransferase family 9 protein [Saprospiraceae bacterium]